MRKFRIPYIPYRSLLLSTTVLNEYNSIESSVVQLWGNKQKFCNSGKHLQTLYSGKYQCTLCSYFKYTRSYIIENTQDEKVSHIMPIHNY